MSRAALCLITFYQRYISPFMTSRCRFYPTCSQYTYLAVQEYGLFRGGLISLKRITRCHPFNPGGYDPIP